jgi:hypothetical protein
MRIKGTCSLLHTCSKNAHAYNLQSHAYNYVRRSRLSWQYVDMTDALSL